MAPQECIQHTTKHTGVMKCLQVNFKWQGDRDNLVYVMQDDGLFQTDIARLCTFSSTQAYSFATFTQNINIYDTIKCEDNE